MDISIWKNKFMKWLIDIISQYIEENYEKNRLLISYNPLMAIALSAEILMKIMTSRKKFENECKRVKKELLKLGQMFISKIEDEKYYEKLITEIDF